MLVNHRQRNHPLARKVRKTPGAEVYPAPVPKGRRRWWGGREAVPVVKNAPVGPPSAGTAELARSPGTPPPLPPLPTHVPIPAGGSSRKIGAGPVLAALVVVTLPLAATAYLVFRSDGAWRQIRTVLQRTAVRGGHPDGMLAEASQPIPRDPQATTQEADRRVMLAWARRTMLSGYDHAGRHGSRWNTEARGFIEQALPWCAGLRDSPVGATDLVPLARRALQPGCDDPLVLYLAGVVEQRADRQSPVAGPLLARAVEEFEHTPYLRGVAMLAAAEMAADCERRRDGTGQDKPAREAWLRWFGQALGDGSFQPDEQAALAWHLARGEGYGLFETNRAACMDLVDHARVGTVAPWLRGWLSGKRHLADAWEARGNGYASEVTPAGWRGFERELALARRDLTASWQLDPHRPEAAGVMITVALGQNARGADGPRAWFDRSVRAQVDYFPAYTKFRQALEPKWGGSLQAMQRFGSTCAANADYHTEVPGYLIHVVRGLHYSEGYRNPEMYAALERVFAGYEAVPLPPNRRAYYHDWHARAAELTGRYAQAYQLLKEVNFVVDPELAASLAGDQEDAGYVQRIAAYGGPGGEDARAGDELLRRKHGETALRRFQAALALEGTEPRAASYLQSRIGALETERRLAAGEWTSVQPASGANGEPVGWTSKLGTWHIAPDGALIGQAGATGLMLVSEAKVGANFELSGELDFLPEAPGEEQSGAMFGHPDLEREDWQSFRLKRNGPDGDIATISRHWHDGPKEPLKVPDHNVFALQAWHGYLTLTVNGEIVFRHERLDQGQVRDGTGLIGLGGYSHHGSTYTVAFRKLQLRRLDKAPPDGHEAATPGTDGKVSAR